MRNLSRSFLISLNDEVVQSIKETLCLFLFSHITSLLQIILNQELRIDSLKTQAATNKALVVDAVDIYTRADNDAFALRISFVRYFLLNTLMPIDMSTIASMS